MAAKRRSRKVLIGVIVIVVIGAVVILNFTGNGDEATVVQADLAYADEITEEVTASGRVEPQTQVDITSEVSAQIVGINIKEGDRVVKGQQLLLLDTVQIRADVDQARYSLEEISARADALRSQSQRDSLEWKRQEQLFAKQLTSETNHTDARLVYENSRANYEAMLAQKKIGMARLEQAEDRLAKTRILAPMDGIITYLGVEVGEIAQAQTSFTQGQTLMTIADLSVFEVKVDVDETEIGKLRLNQDANIRVDAYRDTSFPGEVVEIGNSAKISGQGTENYTTSFGVTIRFDRTDAVIKPGMSATVDITTAYADNALLVPYAAVVTREFDPKDTLLAQNKSDSDGIVATAHAADDVSSAEVGDTATADSNTGEAEQVKQTGVFVIKDGVVSFKPITTGIADERNIVALTGLNPGDTIVSGSFKTLRKLEHGEEVRIEESSLERMEEQK